MNLELLDFWIKKATAKSERKERKGRKVKKELTREDIRSQLLEGMCDCARTPSDQQAFYGKMRYVESTSNWYTFDPGICDRRAFLDIIDLFVPAIMEDPTDKTPHYFRTLAFSLMKQYYDAHPLLREP